MSAGKAAFNMTPHEHYLRAEELLAEGVEVESKVGMLGDRALGIWAQAQVHATLATVLDVAP